MIIGIDPGLAHLGYALINEDKNNELILSGTINTIARKKGIIISTDERINLIVDRLISIFAELKKEPNTGKILLAIVEGTPLIKFQYPNSMRQLSIAFGAVLGTLRSLDIPVKIVYPPTGRRAKGWVAVAWRRLQQQGIEVKTEHEAVALTMARNWKYV